MKVKLKFSKELKYMGNNENTIVLTIEEERFYRDCIFLAKKEYERLKADLYNKFKKEYKECLESFADYINYHCNSGEAELIESTFGHSLLPFHLIGDLISIDGVITPYDIMIDPNVIFCYDSDKLYNLNVKENTIQVEI